MTLTKAHQPNETAKTSKKIMKRKIQSKNVIIKDKAYLLNVDFNEKRCVCSANSAHTSTGVSEWS